MIIHLLIGLTLLGLSIALMNKSIHNPSKAVISLCCFWVSLAYLVGVIIAILIRSV